MEDGEDGKEGEDNDVEGRDVEDDHIDWEEKDVREGGVEDVTYCSMKGGIICLLFSIFN